MRDSWRMKRQFPGLANFSRTIGREIRNARQDEGLTQEQLAAIVDVDRGTIGHFETGSVNPSLLIFVKISAALKLQPHKLLEDAVADYERRHNQKLKLAFGLSDEYVKAQLAGAAKKKLIQRKSDMPVKKVQATQQRPKPVSKTKKR